MVCHPNSLSASTWNLCLDWRHVWLKHHLAYVRIRYNPCYSQFQSFVQRQECWNVSRQLWGHCSSHLSWHPWCHQFCRWPPARLVCHILARRGGVHVYWCCPGDSWPGSLLHCVGGALRVPIRSHRALHPIRGSWGVRGSYCVTSWCYGERQARTTGCIWDNLV